MIINTGFLIFISLISKSSYHISNRRDHLSNAKNFSPVNFLVTYFINRLLLSRLFFSNQPQSCFDTINAAVSYQPFWNKLICLSLLYWLFNFSNSGRFNFRSLSIITVFNCYHITLYFIIHFIYFFASILYWNYFTVNDWGHFSLLIYWGSLHCSRLY